MPSHQNNFNLIRLAAASQVLLVHVANHVGIRSPLFVAIELFPGVPIFFFISGYLIYASFDRLTVDRWKAFYFNRIVRIYPALIVCTLVSVLAVYLTGYFAGKAIEPRLLVPWLLGQVTIVQFYNPPFMRDFGTGVLNGALWTITVELQFYVLVPLLYYLLHHRKLGWVLLFVASVVANVALRVALDWNAVGWKLFTVSFLPWIWMFLLGFWLSSSTAWQQRILRMNAWALLVLFVLSMVLIPSLHENSSNSINPVSVVILTMLLMKIAYADLGKLGRPFYKTDLSYGIYLYHIPIINVLLYSSSWDPGVKAVVTLVATVAMAGLSWVLVEKPALDLKKRRAHNELVLRDAPGAL